MSGGEPEKDGKAAKTKRPPSPATPFVVLAGIGLIAVLVLLFSTKAVAQVQAALYAAALSSLGLAFVRLADGFTETADTRKPKRETGYAKFWLTCFALAFAGLIATETLSRIPSQLETPWLHAARKEPQQPADPRCKAVRAPRANDAQFIAALRAGCR